MPSMEEELAKFEEKIRLARKVEIKESSLKRYVQIAGVFYPFETLTREKINEKLQGKSPYTHNLYK